MKTAIRQMRGVFAELDKAMRLARLRAGKRVKKSNGGWTGGVPPYGWRAENGELVPDVHEQEGVRFAQALRGEGRSLREIGVELDAAEYRPRRGSTWHPQQVSRMFSGPAPAEV